MRTILIAALVLMSAPAWACPPYCAPTPYDHPVPTVSRPTVAEQIRGK